MENFRCLYGGVINIITRQRSMCFPWLVKAYDDYFALRDERVENSLIAKSHPAYATAGKVKEANKRRREAEFQYRLAKYKIEYYEKLFPWLTELISETEEDEELSEHHIFDNNDREDPASKWLTPEEYQSLSRSEKYQKALDRYSHRKKSNWEIGRDYERYCGYRFEKEKWTVDYHGAITGFEDMGRDLIAKRDDQILVIQCKYWSQHKIIHEKHIFQLFGTTIEYWMKLERQNRTIDEFFKNYNEQKIAPVFMTSTALSDTAKAVAGALNVKVHEQFSFQEYPRIKCNVSGREKEKIYHLPFDQ